jgi:tetratricopeptide (TPR) repeat protein
LIGKVQQQSRSGTVIIIVSCLVAITLIVFGQTIRHDFVNYDDDTYVYQNPQVLHGLTIPGCIWAFTHSHSANWHPLTWISHMLDCQVWGLRPGGHHLTSVLLHAVAAVLLFIVLRRMTGALWRSAFVAALFAVHPLHVESVAWIAERKDVLSGVFFLLTLIAYVYYVGKPGSWERYLLMVGLFALGLMAKPTLVTTPFVLLLLDYWPLRRFSPQPLGKSRHSPAIQSRAWHLIIEKLPLFLLCAASCVATILAQKSSITVVAGLRLGWRINNALVSYVLYLRELVWPARLAVLYPHPENNLSLWQVSLAVVVLALITTGTFVLRKKRPYLITGWLWYVGMLVPMIGLMQVGFQSRANRYTYLPHIGLYIMAAWGLTDAVASLPTRRRLLSVTGAVILLLLVSLACIQTSYWKDSESLWIHALRVTSNNAVAHNNLGNFYLDNDRVDEALEQYKLSLDISRPFADQKSKLGLSERAYADAENNFGLALTKKGRTNEAVAHFERVLSRFANNPKAHLNMGNVLLNEGKLDEAIVHYRKALMAYPAYADAHFNLGNALVQKAEGDQAIAQYEQTLDIQPNFAEAENNIGIAFLREGSVGQAVAHWDRALHIQPNFFDVLNNLAWVLATFPEDSVRNGSKALALAERARPIVGDSSPGFLRTLAAAFAECGQFDQATRTAERAVELASRQGDTSLSEVLRDDVARYRGNRPLRTERQLGEGHPR